MSRGTNGVAGALFSALLCLGTAPQSEAQPSPSFAAVIPAAAELRMLAERRFDGSSGLRSSTVYALDVDARGQPWLGTEDGLYSYAGGTWRREPLPAEFADQQVRSLLFSTDHSRWMGTRRGVLRSRSGLPLQRFSEADGLPGPVIYSLAETRAIDGTSRVVVGASNGVAFFDGAKFVRMTLPAGISPLGMMVTATSGADSVPELWVASSLGGVARYREGAWTAFTAREGLDTPDAQYLAAAPGARGARVFVAGIGGVYALDATERRFVRLAGSPARANRVAAVPALSGGFTLWVGTTDGQLYESQGNGMWRAIPSNISERRGTVTLLRAVPRHAGGAAVYISARGGHLSRLSVGVAGTVDLRSGGYEEPLTAVLAVSAAGGRDEVWMGSTRSGLIHLASDGRVERLVRPNGTSYGTVRQIAFVRLDPSLPVGQKVSSAAARMIFVADGRLFVRRDGLIESFGAGLDDRRVHRVQRLTLPDGRDALVAATDRGVVEWTGTRWMPSSLPVSGSVTALASGDVNGAPVIYAGGAHVVHRLMASGSALERIPDVGARALGTGVVSEICRMPVGGSPHLFALDSERGVFWRKEDGGTAWTLLPPRLLSLSSSLGPTSIHCGRNGLLLVSTLTGLAAVDVTKSDTAQWRVATQVSESDGLPSSEVSSVSIGGSTDVVWVGTSAGLGVVDLTAARRQLPARLELRATAEATARELADDLVLDPDENDLHVEPMLFTYHREEETRYRVRLHRRNAIFGGGDEVDGGSASVGIVDSVPEARRSEWLDAPNRYYLDLESGDYDLEAWAYDWAGREYGPVRRTFSVRASIWRTWYALGLYAALAVLLVIAAFRWRVNVIRSNGLRLLESERRLRDSERKFRTIFDRAMDAQLLVDDGRVVTGNAMAATLFGVSMPEQLQHRPLDELVSLPPGTGATTPPPQEFTVRRGDTEVPVQCTVTAVPNEGSLLRHLVIRDLSTVRQAEAEKAWFEAQIREAQKLESLGTLAGGVAHDFNNLLGVIRGNAELAKSALRKGRSNEENLGAILDASDRARDVVRQILTFSRRSTPTREYVNLSRLVLDLQPLLRRMIPRTVTLVIEGAEHSQLMMGDPTQLQQLMLNLVSNAEYAMRDKTDGVLTIALSSRTVPDFAPEPHGSVVVLQVRDTGDGMSADVRNRIFEPFFTTKPTGEGTGLGMAVLHGIVVSHLGRADVMSEIGHGTTFEIVFPRAIIEGLWDEELDETEMITEFEAEDEMSTEAYGSAMDADENDVLEQSPYAGACLVVVDDEPGVSRVVERALQHYGHVVHVFSQPEAALTFIQGQPSAVDLLITDQTMPVMTGDMLAEAVHMLRPDMPVLILTGFSHRLTPERIAAARAHAVLLKPVALDDLRKSVDEALASARG
ncbi:ATP-binding protein [Gemmatimonas groenlandica]|uniref:histidine kinase n=1 Tax=Gemmatimonas groenlandica TaxID=2732249 RepID=A0A6M4ILE1_9BACT|nr:ATP-binding protein [Gemmatimonas groenlandica]QJR34699.1 response regulator [Gemmatimonas groenlandica]